MKKILSLITLGSLFINLLLPFAYASKVYAQEVTPAPAAETVSEPAPVEPTTTEPSQTQAPENTPAATPAPDTSVTPDSNPTPVPSDVLTDQPVPSVSPSSAPAPSVSPTPAPSETPLPDNLPASPSALPKDLPVDPVSSATPADRVWKDLGDKAFETINNVELNQEYTALQNDKVKVKFTKLPETSGKLTIKEIKLSAEKVTELNAVSDTAFEITSTMADQTFEYDLTLPLPPQVQDKDVEVKAAETEAELSSAPKLDEPKEKLAETITIKGLDHFTVFVITLPSPDTAQRVLINEILPNPTAGAEWVELFNNGTQPVNLAAGTGWTIRNSAGDTQSLSALGTIPAAGRAVFNAPANWLSNVAPETVSILNELGSNVDAVTISLVAPGFAIDHYPQAGESVGRKTDGVAEWVIFTTPTKGTANIAPVAPGGGLVEVGPVGSTTGFPLWYKDSNGLALDLHESPDGGFSIGDPIDPANPFSAVVGFNAEGFWWSAEASIARPIGTRAILVLALEAVFAGEAAVDGEQSVQNRLRYRIDGLVPGETYTVTHPFGSIDEVADDAGVINVTDDTGCFDTGIGVTCNQTTAPNFATPLTGQVGPFLVWTTFNTDSTLTDPQLVNPANPGRRYVGNPLIPHAVTGSPTGNNFFRVEGLNVGGPGVNQIQEDLFTVTGRLADANAPVITLFGANPVNAIQGSTYTDAGATAIDDQGGNLTGSIVVTGLPVDTATLGTKTVTYTVTDGVGRTSVATRTVNVVAAGGIDVTAPVITLLGTSPVSVVAGTPYIDAGATALDDVDGDITGSIVTTNPVNTAVVGTYTVTYNVSDAAGNAATPVTRTVNVVADTVAPVITILGSNPVNILIGAPYNDAGATAIDNVGGEISPDIVTTGLPINTAVAGVFTVTYTVTDVAGNTTIVTRTVNVVSTLPTSRLSQAGPLSPDNGFPIWYKDGNGIAVQLCLAGADGLADPNCVLPGAGEEPGFNPALPVSFPDNFPVESFWWIAEIVQDGVGQTGTERLKFRLALEAAHTGEAPVPGTQILFLRVNLTQIADLVPGENYTVTHPFGQFTIHAGNAFLEDGVTPNPDAGVADDGRFFRLEDGAFAPPVTDETAASILPATETHIGSFLKMVNPVPPAGYLGDGATPGTVTPGPNGNFLRIEGLGIDAGNIDGDGNPNSLTINTWTVSGKLADVTPPVITLLGANPDSVVQNAAYTDPGATALDDLDGNVTGSIVTTGVPVDTAVVGAKTITYTVSDRAGNTATATRTVNVTGIDNTAPAITLVGANPASVVVGTVYTDAGATALDNVDGDITAGIITTNPVNTAVIGAYTVTYNVSDAAGNAATPVTRTVNVIATPDITAPVITRLGVSPVNVTVGSVYTDAGATALDNVDGVITANIVTVNPVNTAVIGTYTVTYNVSDAAGNPATEVTRTVNVVAPVDIIPPVITVLGANPVDVTAGTAYVDAGATALDNIDGDITGSIVTTNPVNTAVIGTYTVTYAVFDAAFNLGTATRTVNVVAPVPNTASIAGMVFQDTNANRVKDAGEPVLPGWTLYLDTNTNRVLDAGETSTVSDAAGNYQFSGLLPGTYNINEVKQPNWAIRLPGDNGYNQTLAAGNNITGKDFGNIVTSTVSGQGQGGFATTTGTDLTPSIVSIGDSVIDVPSNGGTSKVTVPADTVITESTGSVFDAAALAASDPAGTVLSGLGSGVVVKGKLQWGVPNLGLVFSNPITLEIFVGTDLNGQTLDILRSVDGTTNWTNDGIVAPGKCTVANGLCTFQATKASFYVAVSIVSSPTPTPTPASTSGGGGGGEGGGGGSASAPTCNDPVAGGAPTLLSATVSGNNEVTLTWSKAADPVTHYVVSYGLSAGNPQFGNPNVGGKDTTSYTVKDLSGGTTYFFRVRAGNGCNAGPYSNEISATPGGRQITGPASGFQAGVLGASTSLGEGTGGADPNSPDAPNAGKGDDVVKEGVAGILGTGQAAADKSDQSIGGFLNSQKAIIAVLLLFITLFAANAYRLRIRRH